MLKPSLGRSPSVKSLYSPKDRQDQRGFRIHLEDSAEDSAGLLGDAGGKVHRQEGHAYSMNPESWRVTQDHPLFRSFEVIFTIEWGAAVGTCHDCLCLFPACKAIKIIKVLPWHDFDVRAAYLEILAAVFSFQLAYFAEPWRCLSVWLCSSTLAIIQLPCCQQLSKLKARACMITSF